MKYAHDNQHFKDAVEQYVHKRIDQLNKFGDGLKDIDPAFFSRHDDAIIYQEWRLCLTSDDRDEIKTRCCEYSTVSEVNYETVKYYDCQRDEEMERRILILIDEKQRNGE